MSFSRGNLTEETNIIKRSWESDPQLGSVTGEQLLTLELEGQRVEGILPSQEPGPLRARQSHRDTSLAGGGTIIKGDWEEVEQR